MHDDKEFMITFDCSVSINNMIYDALSMCSCFITISINQKVTPKKVEKALSQKSISRSRYHRHRKKVL